MIRGMWLSAAALMMLAVPAIAAAPEDACMQPAMPKMPDGKTAPAKDIIAAAAAVKAFVAESDAYQICLKQQVDQIDQMEAKAKTDKTAALDPKVKAAMDKSKAEMTTKGDQNQANKETLGAMYSATAAAYRQAHPK